MTDLDLQDHFEPGEILQARYAPLFSLYLRREAVVIGLTGLIFGPLAILAQDPRVLAALPLVLIIDLVVGDTLGDWQRTRRLRWVLTDRRLMQIDTTDPTETRSIAIGQIARLRRILFWRLFVVAEDRAIVTLSYTPGLRDLHQRLFALREALP